MRWISAALALLVLVLAGCPNEPSPELSPLYYFGTEEASNGLKYAGYWNSGSRTNFAQSDTRSSDAFLSGSTVYVCGVRMNVGVDGYEQACYWTNGSYTALGDTPVADSFAESVRFSGASLYIAGSLEDVSTGAGYWKDGTANPLTDGAWATDALEYGGATFIFGYYWDTSKYVGGYWMIPSSGPTIRSPVATSDGIYVGKGDLHGDNYYMPGKGGYYVIDLTGGTFSFVPLAGANVVNRIHVNSVGVVTAVGTDSSSGFDKASLWIDTVQYWTAPDASEALDAVEYHGSRYVCGIYKVGFDEFACYWEDGVRHPLSSEAGSSAHTALLIE